MKGDIKAFSSFDKNLNIIINILFTLNSTLNLKFLKVIISGIKEIIQAMFILRMEGSNIENRLVIIFKVAYLLKF